MNLRNSDYKTLSEKISKSNSHIIIYGAGMIGQIVLPYIVETYGLHDYIDCYVDADKRKTGKKIAIGTYEYEIKTPEILNWVTENTIIFLACSNFYEAIKFLDGLKSLDGIDCYIIPVMQMAKRSPAIPRTIHYCWFGGRELPDLAKECIESWHQLCPSYEITRWDESNFDVNQYEYTWQAAEKEKWSFVSDVARLDVLYREGGIYMDTDVRLLKPLDGLLHQKGFVGVEKWGNINTGGCVGAVMHHPMIREMLDYRLNFPFVLEDGSLNTTTNGFYESIPFIRQGMRIDNSLQIINGMTVYPASIFHPYDYMSCEEKIEDNTVSIHYFYGGWMESNDWQNRFNTQEKYKTVLKRMHMGDEEGEGL